MRSAPPYGPLWLGTDFSFFKDNTVVQNIRYNHNDDDDDDDDDAPSVGVCSFFNYLLAFGSILCRIAAPSMRRTTLSTHFLRVCHALLFLSIIPDLCTVSK